MAFSSKTNVLFSAALVALLVAFFVVLVQWADGIEKASTPRQNLKGTSNITNQNNNKTAICLVSLIDVEIDTGEEKKSDEEDEDEEVLVCNQVSAKYDTGISDSIMYIKNMDADSIVSNQAALMKNEWFIEISQDWMEQGRHDTSTITIPDRKEVQTIEPSLVPHHPSVSPSHRRQLSLNLNQRRRKLSTIGNRTVVVVSVDLAVSNHLLFDHFFGNNDSLVTQMASCSQGQVHINPHPKHSIIQVSPSKHISQYTFVELYTTILSDVKKKLGLKNGESITSVTDHLFLVVPDDIDRRPGELGWGATPGFFAGTVESLSISRSTMTLLHGEFQNKQSTNSFPTNN